MNTCRHLISARRCGPPFFAASTLLLAVWAAACSPASEPRSGPAAELHAFTGTRTRVVWVQGDGSDPAATGTDLVLMGLDTEDGRGERALLAARGSYVKPMFTARGTDVVYSTRPEGDGPDIHLVDWAGREMSRLADGFALAVWMDPLDGREWVYAGRDNDGYDFARVVRFPIDDPAHTELVWDQTMVSSDTFQLSADGRLAVGLFPWPHVGLAELPNGSWQKMGEGCWTAMTTARGAMFWYFDGAHRNLTVSDVRTGKRWTVPINHAPGFDNAEVYHPRWTNHPRFLTITGPYNRGGANQFASGGAQTEVWLGRFSEDFASIEAWHRVTANRGGDSYPDVWMDRESSPYPIRPAGPIGPAVAADGTRPVSGGAAVSAARLVVDARVSRTSRVPAPRSILPYRHALVVSEYEIVGVIEGAYSGRTVQVARWAIRDQQVLPHAHRDPGSVHRLTLERLDAHRELEGERVINDLGASEGPLFYEIGS